MKLGARTYVLDEPLQVSKLVAGAGIGRTILDFSEADPADFAGSGCVVLGSGAALRDVTVIGIPGIDHYVPAVKLQDAVGAKVEHVRTECAAYAGIFVSGGSDSTIERCQTADSQAAFGLNYGVLLISCARVLVKKCTLQATRHGCAMGPGAPENGDWAEDCVVSDCTLEGTTIYGGDFHGHVRRCRYERCTMNGMTFGGSQNSARDCVITAGYDGRSIHFANLATFNHLVRDCVITGANDGIKGMVEFDRVPGQDTVDVEAGGTLRLVGNTVSGTGRGLMLRNRFDDALPNLILDDNEVDCTVGSTIRSLGVPSRWATAIIRANRWKAGFGLDYGAHITSPTETETMRFR